MSVSYCPGLLARASAPAVALGLSLAANTAAWAQDQSPATETTVTPLVVSPTRVPTPINQVASSVTVITAKEIELKQERNLPDILRDVPGLNLIQTGGPGGVTSLFIRGTDSNHTKVLVDGIDVTDPTTPDGTFQFQTLLAAGLKQVEVLRGPQSGLYGSDAIGGVVDVTTRTGSGPAHGELTLEGGSFGTFNQTGSVSGSLDRFSYALDLARLSSTNTPVTPTNLLAPGEPRKDDAYQNDTVATRLGYRVTDNFDLGLVVRYVHTDLHFTSDFDFGAGPDPVQSKSLADQVFTRATAHLSLFDDRFEQTLGFGYTDYRRDDFVPNNPASPNDGDRYKLDWQGTIKLIPGETLILGAEHQRDEIIDSPVSASMTNNAGYIELDSNVGDRFFSTFSGRVDGNDRFGEYGTYRVAPSYLFLETGTRLKASVGTGFKAPTLNQLFVSFPAFFFFANPNLKPEHSFGYDIGFEQNLPWSAQFGATWFHNDITDLITANTDFTMDVNIGKATTQGVEAFFAWRPLASLNLRGDYTYTDAEDDIAHQQLLRRPKDKATLSVVWQATPRLSVTAEGLYVGPWIDGNRDFSIARLTAAGYATLNLTANYQVVKNLGVFGRITNLFDKQYQDPEGFLQPGIGAFAGAKVSF